MGVKTNIRRNSGKRKVTLGEAFGEFQFQKMGQGVSQSTIRNYRQSYQYFVEFNEWDSDTPVEKVRDNDVAGWIISMITLEEMKPTTVNHYVRDVRAFLYWCMDKEYLPYFKIKEVKGQEEEIKLFSDNDLKKLLEMPHKKEVFSTWRTWAIVNFVLATGCRASSIVNVKIGDIDFTNSQISIRHTKNKKLLQLPLSSELERVLRDYIRTFLGDKDDDCYLFPSISAEQLTTNALAHSFARYCDDREVSKTSIHGLRHNFAKAYLLNGGNMLKLQKILGHSTLEMTRRYAKMFIDDLKIDFDEVAPLDNIQKAKSRKSNIHRAR